MQNKLNNFQNGLIAEEIAIKYLKKQKHIILAHRFKYKTGEIDIIALHKKLVIFCEVKTSVDAVNIYYQLQIKQQQRIINTAKYWLVQNTKYRNFDMRFDCIFVDNDKVISHVQDAWQEF